MVGLRSLSGKVTQPDQRFANKEHEVMGMNEKILDLAKLLFKSMLLLFFFSKN